MTPLYHPLVIHPPTLLCEILLALQTSTTGDLVFSIRHMPLPLKFLQCTLPSASSSSETKLVKSQVFDDINIDVQNVLPRSFEPVCLLCEGTSISNCPPSDGSVSVDTLERDFVWVLHLSAHFEYNKGPTSPSNVIDTVDNRQGQESPNGKTPGSGG